MESIALSNLEVYVLSLMVCQFMKTNLGTVIAIMLLIQIVGSMKCLYIVPCYEMISHKRIVLSHATLMLLVLR